MKKLIILCVLTCCSCQLVFSQQDRTLFGKNLSMSASWAGMNFTTSEIKGVTANQLGLDIGFEYNGTFLTGYQWRTTMDELTLSDLTANNRLKFGYHTFLVGYTLPTYKVIHPRLTFGIGPGQVKLAGNKDQLFVLQPALGLEINLFQWMRLSLDGGYRKVSGIQTNDLDNDDLTNFFGAVSLKFGWSWGRHH